LWLRAGRARLTACMHECVIDCWRVSRLVGSDTGLYSFPPSSTPTRPSMDGVDIGHLLCASSTHNRPPPAAQKLQTSCAAAAFQKSTPRCTTSRPICAQQRDFSQTLSTHANTHTHTQTALFSAPWQYFCSRQFGVWRYIQSCACWDWGASRNQRMGFRVTSVYIHTLYRQKDYMAIG
jgi:hypothetical protein